MGEFSEITSGSVELNSMLFPESDCLEKMTNRYSKTKYALLKKANSKFFLPKKMRRIMYFLMQNSYLRNHKKSYTKEWSVSCLRYSNPIALRGEYYYFTVRLL
jgi:hypothetical protein